MDQFRFVAVRLGFAELLVLFQHAGNVEEHLDEGEWFDRICLIRVGMTAACRGEANRLGDGAGVRRARAGPASW